MACAFKCDRCGKYYDKSTLENGPRLYKDKNTTVLDLCEECKASLIDWLNHEEHVEHIERFIKRRVFKLGKSDATAPCILVNHFIDALMKFFNYRWEEEVENFISENMCLTDRITVNKVKECLAKYFDYEWRDEFYNYG